jgi:N-formylglutamate deformylase
VKTVPMFYLFRGSGSLLVSLPHVGTHIPGDLRPHYVQRALASEDTDWHLDQLYDFVREFDATVLLATHSRYVIDLNRPPDDQPMYPGASNTELCPTKFFTGDLLYRSGQEPDAMEVGRRRARYWWPYHLTLNNELQRLRAKHRHVVHWDGHSIRSQIPWLFEGKLRDLNLGTADGASCAPSLRETLVKAMSAQNRYTHVVDGRFKGGYTTRHYGKPSEGVHTVQMEMCQSTYMDEAPPFTIDAKRSHDVRNALRELLSVAAAWRPTSEEDVLS